MPIRILPPEVASQIAAGEVVERPASVVKELVENALDAGARTISVNILDAGRRMIEVLDDGCGISDQELPLAVGRHATSKLQSADDLFRIATLGFRGEALASIGSISKLTITSRTTESPVAFRIVVDGGKNGTIEQASAPVGTSIRVEDLFYNVPARLKFLKTDNTERRQIDTLMTRYALAYPQVRFKLSYGSNTSLQTTGDGDRRTILATLYGVETARDMLEVQAQENSESAGTATLSGYISPLSLTRSNRREITFFVNGRWVQDIALSTALIQAYHTMLMVGRYPMAVIFLELEPGAVDVNVHPAKAEVRFREQDRIFSFVQRAVRRALLAYSPVPQTTPASLWGNTARQQNQLEWNLAHDTDLELPAGQGDAVPASVPSPTRSQPEAFSRMPLLRLIGQIGATYLVAEGPDGLYLIDQHAAHERVLFEKLMAQRAEKNIPAQALLTPTTITLPPAQARLLEEQIEWMQHLGFDLVPFGPNTCQVRAIPALFSGADPAAALRALVEDFEEDEAPLQEEIEARIAARVCKRLAVKAGTTLSGDEQRALLIDLEACLSPRTCPHGRPTMIHLSVDALERQFGRKGAI